MWGFCSLRIYLIWKDFPFHFPVASESELASTVQFWCSSPAVCRERACKKNPQSPRPLLSRQSRWLPARLQCALLQTGSLGGSRLIPKLGSVARGEPTDHCCSRQALNFCRPGGQNCPRGLESFVPAVVQISLYIARYGT